MSSGPVHEFTTAALKWKPFVTPIPLEEATEEQRDALKVTPSSTKVSDYLLVLAHDPETLSVRTPLYNAIMYDREGLSRAEREIGATAASIVNRCVYCASVHASRFISLAKRPEVIEEIFSRETEAQLDPRLQSIFDFAVKLSATPPAVTKQDLEALKEQGFSELEIVDLILSTSLFAWANRLMHTLGEPYPTDGGA